ncbi:MAG TPA: alpha/beta hydrolase [Aldersonia sp.]
MQRWEFDDIALTYELHERGGPPVLLVHARPFVAWYGPLIEQLTDFSTLSFRRDLRKLAGRPYRHLTVAEDAAIAARLMEHVGWPQAHVVGHSYGALVALQMAVDTPERVGSVALLEPAARGVSSAPAVVAALQAIIGAYRSGDTEGALDGFLCHVCGAGYRSVLDTALPGAFGEALAAADLFFQAELPAVGQFSFGPDAAARVPQPVLNVLGARSAQRFVEGSELVQSWFPGAERLSVPAAGHFLMVQNPTAVADGLRDYFTRHPVSGVVIQTAGS